MFHHDTSIPSQTKPAFRSSALTMYYFLKPDFRLQQFWRVLPRYLFVTSGEPAAMPLPGEVPRKG